MSEHPIPKNKKVNSYLKYTGLGFQMAGVFVVGIFGGQWIDSKIGLDTPVATIFLLLILFTGYMYKIYNDLS